MKINDIAKEIARREGKKSQARMGDIKEILGILADIFFDDVMNGDMEIYPIFLNLGLKRDKKKNAKKRVKK